MIFSVDGHIEQIVNGIKTQTRRESDRYEVGKTYAIQSCRTCRGIAGGRIRIIGKHGEGWLKTSLDGGRQPFQISEENAKAEGGYSPEEFESLYLELHPEWSWRTAYEFVFVPTTYKGGDS